MDVPTQQIITCGAKIWLRLLQESWNNPSPIADILKSEILALIGVK
jgi:hypothetical protein